MTQSDIVLASGPCIMPLLGDSYLQQPLAYRAQNAIGIFALGIELTIEQ